MDKRIRIAIFIDGGNFYHSTKHLEDKGYEINFQKIINELAGNRKLVRALYYTALLDKEYNLRKYLEHKEFLDHLKKIPDFKIVLCYLRKIKTRNKINYQIKGDDIKLAHDLLIGAFEDFYDIAIIVSGDSDFIPVISTLRKKFNKKVGNAFFRRTSSFKLRKACNFSVNMNKLILKLNRNKEASVPPNDDTSQLY